MLPHLPRPSPSDPLPSQLTLPPPTFRSAAQLWIRRRAGQAAARAKLKRELTQAKRAEAMEKIKMEEAEAELRAAEEEVTPLAAALAPLAHATWKLCKRL